MNRAKFKEWFVLDVDCEGKDRRAGGKMLNPVPDLIIERGQLKLKSHRIG